MRVVVTNAFPDDNRGGAAITTQTVRMLYEAFPGAEIALMAVRDEPDLSRAFRHVLAAFPAVRLLPPPVVVGDERGAGMRALLRAVRAVLLARQKGAAFSALADADLVVSKGGHYFIDRPSWRRTSGLALLLLPLLYALRIGRPVVLSGAHVGPTARLSTRLLLGPVFRGAMAIAVRDDVSAATARRLGAPPGRIRILPDSAFAMPAPAPAEVERIVTQLGLRGKSFGIICVRRKGAHTWQLGQRMTTLANALLDAQLVDTLVGVVQVNPPEDDDMLVMRSVAARTEGRIVVVEEDLSPGELVSLYAAAEWVVTSRLHAAIFSVIAETPAVCVSISDKARRVFGALGLHDWVVDASAPDGAIVALAKHMSDPDERARIEGPARRCRATLEENMVPLLRSAVDPSSL